VRYKEISSSPFATALLRAVRRLENTVAVMATALQRCT